MIVVRNTRLGRSVFASEPLLPGQVILRGWGPRVPRRTRHTFQVDIDTHIVIRSPIELINHGCDPNCGVLIRRGAKALEIHALRPIDEGEELTIDYATFEYELEHFHRPCLCGASTCRGRITGYKDLHEHLREAYGPYIAEYLLEMDAAVSEVR